MDFKEIVKKLFWYVCFVLLGKCLKTFALINYPSKLLLNVPNFIYFIKKIIFDPKKITPNFDIILKNGYLLAVCYIFSIKNFKIKKILNI